MNFAATMTVSVVVELIEGAFPLCHEAVLGASPSKQYGFLRLKVKLL
jgi:hypothetical protein